MSNNTANVVFRDDGTILVKNVRLSYPHIFEPWAKKETEKKKFSCKVILPNDTHKEDIRAIAARIVALCQEKWKARLPNSQVFLRNGDDMAKEEMENSFVISCSENTRPDILLANKKRITTDDGTFYPGCWVNLLIRPWLQDNEHGRRVNANFLAIQFVRDDESFSSVERPDADDVFGAVEEDFSGAAGDGGDPFAD